jgi:hypothetical protein
MKTFQKLALVTAIAAAPFAQAELTSIDDSVLSDMTGQAGISIDLSAQIAVGSVTYTDTDGFPGSAAAGTISIGQIYLGGADAVDGFGDSVADGGSDTLNALDGIKIDIDVDANAGLVIHLGGTNAYASLTGAETVDFGLSVADVKMNAVTLASDIVIVGELGPIDVNITNAGAINVGAFFKVNSGSMNIDLLGMGVTSLQIDQDSNPFMNVSPYGAKVNATVAAGDYATAAGAGAGSTSAGDLALFDTDGSGGATTAEILAIVDLAANGGDGDGVATVAETDAYYAAAGAAPAGTVIEGARVANGLVGFDDFAYVAMGIQTGTADYVTTGGVLVAVDSLNISITSMSMDIETTLTLGADDSLAPGTKVAASLGTVSIQDLDLSGTTLAIYGH